MFPFTSWPINIITFCILRYANQWATHPGPNTIHPLVNARSLSWQILVVLLTAPTCVHLQRVSVLLKELVMTLVSANNKDGQSFVVVAVLLRTSSSGMKIREDINFIADRTKHLPPLCRCRRWRDYFEKEKLQFG